jgi:predicted XRE-type DNA-binding protein
MTGSGASVSRAKGTLRRSRNVAAKHPQPRSSRSDDASRPRKSTSRNTRAAPSTRSRTDDSPAVIAGSGNVFADLELPHPDLALAKAELVQRLRELIAERQLTQARAGQLLGLDQPKVSALLRGRVSGYSIDRLFRYLNALGQQVEITVRSARSAGKTSGQRVILVTQ